MNYRHAFHAGNFADVVKHAVLASVLTYMKQKSAPFRVIDHVGHAVLTEADGSSQEGWGLFEHATMGAHAPSGFTDFGSVAPLP